MMRASFAVGLFNSWVIIDLLKVTCLTLTCKPALVRFGLAYNIPTGHAPKKKSCAVRIAACLRKPLRRAHKIMDALL